MNDWNTEIGKTEMSRYIYYQLRDLTRAVVDLRIAVVELKEVLKERE
jgi:hypothetical protein